jgi:hypothetical protein
LPGDTFDDDGELGYCWMHHFKCHSARSCHTWAKGGPIKTEKESAEWQGKAFGVKEEITDFNTEDPMNSVIAIRGIGTMSISSALEKVSEMAMDIAKLGAMKDAKNVQDNLPRYMDLLATYNESIQEAYRELAQQRKRGGTASRGIDKDISEDDITDRNKKALQKALMVKNIQALQKKMPMEALSDEEMDAFHVELDKLVHKYFGHSSDEKKMDEHCGDPMAHDHAPGRMLLMKLYKKEMQCQPGSPEHFEVMRMIDGCRKNIGLEEGVFDKVVNYAKDQVAQRKATFSGKKQK